MKLRVIFVLESGFCAAALSFEGARGTGDDQDGVGRRVYG